MTKVTYLQLAFKTKKQVVSCDKVQTKLIKITYMHTRNYTVSQKKTGPLLRFEVTPTNCA